MLLEILSGFFRIPFEPHHITITSSCC
jgi:hypothetical protein